MKRKIETIKKQLKIENAYIDGEKYYEKVDQNKKLISNIKNNKKRKKN